MSHDQEPQASVHPAQRVDSAPSESLGELLRNRALVTSPQLLAGQAVAGVALNVASMVWNPDRWGIAIAALATVTLHAVWGLSVQRTNGASGTRAWWRVRRATAISAGACAVLTFLFVSMMLLGRLQS